MLPRYMCVLTLLAAVSCAQESKPFAGAEFYATLAKARELRRADRLADAAPLYQRLVAASPGDSLLWREYGAVQSRLKEYRGSAESFEKAFTLGAPYSAIAAISVARMHARAGDKSKAYEWIEKALAVPYENRPSLMVDPAFEQMRGEERFRNLAGQLPQREFGRENGWRYDLDYFAAEIKRLHYKGWKYKKLPEEFESGLARLRSKVAELNDLQIKAELQRLMATLGDGHTRFQLLGQNEFKPIAHEFYQFADGLFVIAAPDDCHCLGAKVVGIEGRDTRVVMQALRPYASHENAVGPVVETTRLVRSAGLLHAAGVARSPGALTFEVELGGKRSSITAPATSSVRFGALLPPPPGKPAPLYLRNPQTAYWTEPLVPGNTLYFNFSQVLDRDGETIEQLSRKLGTILHDGGYRNLVIDVRFNGGGNLDLLPPLIRELIRFELAREGNRIYVITGRQTYSAAQVFINELDRWANPVFAGEPSSSRPNFIGESAPIRLPYSGLMGSVSSRYHPTDTMDDRDMIVPSIPVAMTSRDYFDGRDPVLDAVLEVIRSAPRP